MVTASEKLDAGSLLAVFDALPDPAMIVRGDPYGTMRRVALANPAARRTFTLPEGEPMLAQVIRRPEVLDLIEASLTHGAGGEVAWESGAAQDRSLTAVVRPLPPPARGERLSLLIVRDETDARRNERMRADFLANASHELKTPLASLTGFIETLRGHAKDDPGARERFLGVMADQAERMGRLVQDLMSLSRIELNEHIPPSGEVDLVACARDVADAMAPIATAAKVRIEVTGARHGAVVGDRHQLIQVLQNLIENAVKYTPAGGTVGVEITLGLNALQAGASRSDRSASRALLTPDNLTAPVVAVRVSDQGPGIEREHLPRLTERFYRAPGQKSSETPGTGLGLAIVKHIVNRHRGGLFVETVKGEGAAFTACFPEA
jgi:two-component system phosphate regulon sensor histidine kinase PhoR